MRVEHHQNEAHKNSADTPWTPTPENLNVLFHSMHWHFLYSEWCCFFFSLIIHVFPFPFSSCGVAFSGKFQFVFMWGHIKKGLKAEKVPLIFSPKSTMRQTCWLPTRILSDEIEHVCHMWLYSDYNDDYVHLKQHDPGLLPCFPHQQHTDSFLIISSA